MRRATITLNDTIEASLDAYIKRDGCTSPPRRKAAARKTLASITTTISPGYFR